MALKQNLISSAINKVKSFASGIGQNISNSVNDNQGWIQQGKFTPGKQIASQINYQKQVSPINRALYTGIETAGRPIVNSLANIGALGATALGSAQMTFNKPQAAEKSYKTAIDLRNFAGTQGSFDQGTGLQTLKKGGIDAIQTALTGKGLKYMTPANLGISSLLGGTMSKLSGGDFATGAGRAMGTLPSIMGAVGLTNPALAKLIPAKASGVASRLTGGLLNVAQGVGINASQGMPNTPASLGLDLVTGLAGGKTQFDAPNLKMGITDQSKGVIPEAGGVIPTVKQSTEIPQGKIPIKGKTLPVEKVPEIVQPAQVNTQQNKVLKPNKLDSASESIIQQARNQIGKPTEVKKSLSQKFDQFYTDWVDRYNPLVKLTKGVKNLDPTKDPKYVIRRFLGAGSIAEQRFNSEMKPLLKSVDDLGIDKLDLDAYLINKRNVGFGEIGRVVKGSDPIKSQKVVSALEAKYGTDISGIADKLYLFQNQGLEDMVKAGFISPEGASAMKGQNPDYAPFQRVMDELDDYLGMPTKKAMQGTQPIKKLKGSERQILSPVESIIANIFSQRAAIEKNNVAKSVAGLKDLMPNIGFKTVSKGGDSTITVWSGGKKVFVEVGSDISRAMKGMNEETAGSLMKILTAPASLLRQGATGRNPEFMLPNIVRDQLDAAVNSKYGYVPFVDYVRGLAHIVKKDEIFDKWMSSGGAQSFGSISGRKSISAMFDEKTAKKGLFSWLGKGLDLMGKYSEQPTRVGLFAKTLKKTGNELVSAYESREGTMDFARMGAKMKVANSIIPFLNVQVQGFDKMIRNFKDAPVKTAIKMGIYGVTPAVLATLYNERYHSEEYAEIPQFVKDDNFILVKGRNDKGTVDYVTIPKGNLIRLVTNPAEHFVSYLAGNDKTTFGEMVTSLLSSNIPLLGEGASVGEVALKTVGQNIPQAIKPITENLVNKSFFKYDTKKEQSKNIVPDYLLSKPPADQTYKFTPAMYQVIGKVINVSPLKVQNLMEGYLAGYTKIPANIIDSLKNISEGKPAEQNKVPILRRFLQETYPTTTTKPKVKAETTPLIPQAKAAEGGFLSKIFPKKAPETAETMTEIPYVNENGNDAKIILSKYDDIAKMPTSNKYEVALKESKQFSSAATILDNQYLTAEQKQVVLKRLGIDQPTAAYYQVANDNTNLKTLWVMDKLEGATDKNSVIEGLSNLRKQVNGQMIASNAVLDNLVDEGVISKAEATQLKKYKFEGGKLTPIKKTGTKAKKPKKVSIKRAPKIKIAKSKKIKITTVKSKAYKPIRFKIPKKMKIKKIAIKKLK